MKDRLLLSTENIHPSIRDRVSGYHQNTISEVISAISNNPIVVVGMSLNPHCKRAKKVLGAADRSFKYIEFGGYQSQWRRRSALKMWSGWPTFPMVFVNGQLIGGADELNAISCNGQLDALLNDSKA